MFREAVEAQKRSIPLLIGAAISMVSIVTIPWAVRRFKERRLQNKLETSLEKFVLLLLISHLQSFCNFSREAGESDSFEQMFDGKEEEVLKECKPS